MSDESNGDDLELLETCVGCGIEIPVDTPAYGLPDDEWLCLECAVAAGAAYDPAEERWVQAPHA